METTPTSSTKPAGQTRGQQFFRSASTRVRRYHVHTSLIPPTTQQTEPKPGDALALLGWHLEQICTHVLTASTQEEFYSRAIGSLDDFAETHNALDTIHRLAVGKNEDPSRGRHDVLVALLGVMARSTVRTRSAEVDAAARSVFASIDTLSTFAARAVLDADTEEDRYLAEQFQAHFAVHYFMLWCLFLCSARGELLNSTGFECAVDMFVQSADYVASPVAAADRLRRRKAVHDAALSADIHEDEIASPKSMSLGEFEAWLQTGEGAELLKELTDEEKAAVAHLRKAGLIVRVSGRPRRLFFGGVSVTEDAEIPVFSQGFTIVMGADGRFSTSVVGKGNHNLRSTAATLTQAVRDVLEAYRSTLDHQHSVASR